MLSAEHKRKLIEQTRLERSKRSKNLEYGSGDRPRCRGEEAALKEPGEQFKAVFDNTLIGLYRTTPDGLILMANPALVKMLGYSSFDELAGRNLEREGYEPQYSRLAFKDRIEDEGNVIGLESAWKKPDGTTLYVRESAHAVRDEFGKTLYYQGTVEDITEYKQAEEAFREAHDELERRVVERTAELAFANSALEEKIAELFRTQEALQSNEEQLRLVTDNVPVLISYVDSNQRYQFNSKAYEQWFGHGRKDISGMHVRDVLGEAAHEEVRTYIEAALSGQTVCYERDVSCRDAGIRHIQATYVPHLQAGEVVGFFALAVDITELKQAEGALRQSELQHRTLFETMAQGVTYQDADGRIISANRAAEHILGLTLDQMKGLTSLDPCWKAIRKDGSDFPGQDHPSMVSLKTGHPQKDICMGVFNPLDGEYRWISISSVPQYRSGEDRPYQVFTTFDDITDRKEAEAALRKSEQKLRSIIDHSRELFYIHDTGHKLTYVSPQSEEILGYSPEEMMVKWTSLTTDSPINAKGFELTEAAIITGKRQEPYPLELRRKDGKTIIGEVDESPIKDDGGNVVAITGALADITERKKTIEALKESEQRFRSLSEAAFEGIVFSENGVLVDANEAFARIYRCSLEELIGKPIMELVAPEHRELVANNIRSGYEGVYEHKGIRRDGSIVYVEIHGRAITYQGRKMRMTALRDITERKKVELALQESEERLKILFEYAPDGIYLHDLNGNLIDGNKAAEELVGYPREALIGKKFAEAGLLSPEDAKKALERLKKTAVGEPVGPEEFCLIRSDGSKINVEISTFPVTIQGERLSLGIARDITERKRAERRVLEDREQLKSLASQLSITEERERHRLATVLHDQIGQSLVFSKLKLDMLRKSESSDELTEALEEICINLGQVIDDTRTLTFDLSSPILYELGLEAAITEWLKDEIQNKHGIETKFEDDMQPKPLDADIRAVLFRNVQELLVNTVKHARASKVKVCVHRVDGSIRVSVEDDGVGFDPVGVTSRAAKRAEFGLYSIRQRLEQLGGVIEIDSAPGRGCRISMTALLKQDKNGSDSHS